VILQFWGTVHKEREYKSICLEEFTKRTQNVCEDKQRVFSKTNIQAIDD
jgi:hypothetical protein